MGPSQHDDDHTIKSYKRHRTILYQGEIPKNVYIIKKGFVRVYNILSNGEERTVSLLSEGDIVATNWVFGNSRAALYYYDAFSDVIVAVLTKEAFGRQLKNPDFNRSIMESLARRAAANTMHTNALLQTYASQKIAHGLQFLVLSSGRKLPNGKYKIGIRLTQQDLADLVGVTRETAALELNKLKAKKNISYSGFTYTVDYEALIRSNGGDEFIGLSI
jgi:CRP/FNR family cyclic AMP-dependent transcriptional regulator